jgi:peptidoglycan/xylan/chitin deacetylase (PgdA/CDA1 family)
MARMDTRRGRRPSLPSLWRRAASACALSLILALPVAAGLIEIGPDATRPAPVAKGAQDQGAPRVDAPFPLGPPQVPSELPPSAAAQPAAVAKPRSAISVPILTYHWIRTNPVPADQLGFHLSVTPENFAQQMAFLHYAGVHPITLADAMSALQTGKPLPARPVILTFDDGYGDFATRATPVLQRYGFVGTDYVVSGFMGRPAYMTADQVREVDRAGMVIGCHTVNHVDLARVPPPVAANQIKVSHQQLEQLLGHKVLDFAYPYGSSDGTVEQMVLADGFRDAVTTHGGTWLQTSNRGAWPRLHVDGGDGLASFAAKALSGTPQATVQQLLQGFADSQAGQPQPSPTPTHRIAVADPGTEPGRFA